MIAPFSFLNRLLSLAVALLLALPPSLSSEERSEGAASESLLERSADKLPQSGDLEYIPSSSYDLLDRQQGYRERYRLRGYQQLDEEGQEELFMERRLEEQFGDEGFPADMGQQQYRESAGRRFSIIFFLSLPFATLYSYGIWSGVRALGGNADEALGGGEHIGIVGAGALLAALIGWYDNRQVGGAGEQALSAAPAGNSSIHSHHSHSFSSSSSAVASIYLSGDLSGKLPRELSGGLSGDLSAKWRSGWRYCYAWSLRLEL